MPNNVSLYDLQGRGHNYLRISITENCNLRCTYCMPAEGISLTQKSHLMTADEIVAIAETFVGLGVDKIRLTGGEPLVRKDAAEIILRLGKLGVDLRITTNGILIPKFIETFREANIRTVNVSIDSLVREKFNSVTRRDYFDTVFSNIILLIELGFCVKLNIVLIKGFNEDEITDFIWLTKDKDIQVRFIEFMPFRDNQWDRSKLVSLAEIIEKTRSTFALSEIKRLSDDPHDTARNYKIDGHKGSFAIISSVTNPFCSTCNRIRLTADGKLKNCLFSDSETSLLPTFRAGGNIIPLIEENLRMKKAIRGGLDDDHKLENPELFSKNRSMIAIGG